MLGIENIATYIPETKKSNYDLKEKFEIDDDFIENKIGVKYHALKDEGFKSSDMCVKAFEELQKNSDINSEEIECCIVVTQNPDFNIPHTSAIVHGRLGLPDNCAAFDISLGCSGYVYGLSNIIAFMKNNGMKKGLLFTSDQYSDIVDEDDKNTALLFGDAATVTLISEDPTLIPVDFSFGTNGKEYKELICKDELYMNGRAVFSFTATTAPKHIKALLEKNNLVDEDIERYYLHQGSKYIVDTIRKRLKVNEEKVPFDMAEYGNTISSSIPIMLAKDINTLPKGKVVLSAFGVGLSWASAIIEKIK
ncbi:MAG: ketoacyl-ACP synthase III [Sulfurimonadaceae bacterium]